MTFCDHFNQGRCRSCSWIEEPYPNQLQRKETLLREALAGHEPFVLESTWRSPEQAFRNRAKMSVTGTAREPIVGLLGEGSLDQGRELLDCPIHHPVLNELLAAMPGFIRDHQIDPYRISEKSGELKGLIAFHSPHSGESYLRFVLRSRASIDRIRAGLPSLQAQVSSLKCVSANIQPIPHAILEGPEEISLTEQTSIEHRLGSWSLRLAPQAFVQTHVEGATQLYQQAADWIAKRRPERMLELFCGQGAFSFFASGSAKRVLGIEINKDAVQSARETADALSLSHLSFQASDASQVEAEIRAFAPDLILANPPRRGLSDSLSLILQAAPRDFIYSSCSLASLAADAHVLSGRYRLKMAKIFDLFPHTAHFETLAWFEVR